MENRCVMGAVTRGRGHAWLCEACVSLLCWLIAGSWVLAWLLLCSVGEPFDNDLIIYGQIL